MSPSPILKNVTYVTVDLEYNPGKHDGLPVTSVTPVNALKTMIFVMAMTFVIDLQPA